MKGISVASLRDGRQSALPTVLVAHRPWPHAAAAAESNVQLQLSGQLIDSGCVQIRLSLHSLVLSCTSTLSRRLGWRGGWVGGFSTLLLSLYQEQTLNRPDC